MSPDVHADRRRRLAERVGAPILLPGNGHRSTNLPMNHVRFRQDSNLLYFTGCDLPDAAALLHEGRCTLFLPRPAADDALWHGPTPPPDAIGLALGVDAVLPRAALSASLPVGTRTVAVGDEEVNRELAQALGRPLRFGVAPGDVDLIDAIIALRRAKGPEEIAALREAARHTEAAFDAVMRGCRPGGGERALAALFEGVLAARGLSTGYATILTQSGEVLHHHGHADPLVAGRLLLLDGGGELPSGYGVDITRTWPVSGRFEPRQRAAYEAVLAAQRAGIEAARVGVRNRAVHDAASRVLAEWLRDEGLLRVDPDEAVATGAHAAFFPHGIGHFLGLDVHDLEAFGDRPSYPPGQGRPEPFGTRYLRMDLPLEPGWVITVEPGFYVVPAILEDPSLREHFGDRVDFERARAWYGFGGIRVEDDVHITAAGPEVLTAVPKEVDALEAIVGAGPTAEERLCCT
jgi:Xaa-Pro aminopeptidase